MGTKISRILIIAICFLCLTACSTNGTVYEKTPHISEPQGTVPKDLIIVSNYNSIKDELENMIKKAKPSEKFAVVDYWGDIDSDIKTIIQDITTKDAVGSFAVSSIVYEQAKATGYYQVSVSVQYKKTAEEINGIIKVSTLKELEQYIAKMFVEYDKYSAYSIYTSKSAEAMMELIYKVYYNNPYYAIGLKNVKLNAMKEEFTEQILEVELEFLNDLPQTLEKRAALKERVKNICAEQKIKSTDEKIEYIVNYMSQVLLDEEAMIMVEETKDSQPKTDVYSAYGAAVNGKAAQSGIALLTKLLCDELEIPNSLIVGEKDGVPHLWLIIKRGENWQHFDVSNGTENYIISSIDLAQNYKYNMELFSVN